MSEERNPNKEPVEILIVEDSPTQAEQLKYLLEHHHYKVTVAANGKLALDLLEKYKPTLIISDVNMPVMNGFEMCEQIKKEESTLDIPLILLTALTNSEDVLEGLASGADHFITKPYNADYVISVIAKILADLKFRKKERVRVGVEIEFGGKRRFITADQQQMLTLLISTYEAAIHKNAELIQTENELKSLNDDLESLVEQRTAELRKNEDLLYEALKIAKIGYWEYEFATDEFLFNDKYYMLHKITADEAGGYRMSSADFAQRYVHPEDAPIVGQNVQRAFKSDDPDYFAMTEIRILTGDGDVVWVDVRFRVEKNSQGQTIRLLGVNQDITVRKLAVQEKEILEAQLRQAQKMESIGRLAGGVAHDFNNLLTVILGYTEMTMEQLPEDSPQHGNLQQVMDASQSAADLTQQLLAFSRKQLISQQILDVNAILVSSEKMLKRLLGEDLDLIFFPDGDLWRVKADPNQINQILMNLSVNARDAMPNGGKLSIETQNMTLSEKKCQTCMVPITGDYVMIAVSDTGTGITPQALEKIFEPFYTTKDLNKGTGLGLSMVHGIVHQNGGHINVYSEPGVGTSFKIYLPRADAEATVREEVVEPLQIAGSETVLLVEDMESVRKMAKSALEDQGYTVIEAQDGEEALHLGMEALDTIDFILTDVVMPKLNGKKLCDELQALKPGLKVLYMSGYTENAIAHQGVLDEGTDFIQKPFNQRNLVRRVREILDKGAVAPRRYRPDEDTAG